MAARFEKTMVMNYLLKTHRLGAAAPGELPGEITQNACIDLHQTGSVGEGSGHLQLIKFWRSCAPGKGVCGRTKIIGFPYYSQRGLFASKEGYGGSTFFAPPYYSQRAVFASL